MGIIGVPFFISFTPSMMIQRLFILFLILISSFESRAQMGISVSPPRVYYTAAPGQTWVKEVLVTNVSEEHVLELAVTLGDWNYDEFGSNLLFSADSLENSCAAWVSLAEGSYFTLKPQESKNISVEMTVSENVNRDLPVHTAMLYVTQMNPIDEVNQEGANIRVSVRSGIKLFQRFDVPRISNLDITDFSFSGEENALELQFSNEGNVWADGVVAAYLFNQNTGEEIELEQQGFRTLPGDLRILKLKLSEELKKGSYTATAMIHLENSDHVQAAELQFDHE